jgi:hypothetical protein
LVARIKRWWKSKPQPTPTPTPQPTPEPAPTPSPVPSGVAWASFNAPDFFQHGTPVENQYRQSAIEQAKPTGCIRAKINYGLGDEQCMHLFALEHPTKPGYYLKEDSWFFQAERQGITRWILDLGTPDMAQAERVMWLTKSPYYKGRLQYVCTRATAGGVIAKLKGNAQGCEVLVE